VKLPGVTVPTAVDLAITGRSARDIARSSLALGSSAGVVASLFLGGMALVGLPVGAPVSIALVVLLGWAGLNHPGRRCREEARRRRVRIDMSAAVVLDLINVQTAGGCGLETALVSAASVGNGEGFRSIQMCISRAQAARTSYWDALRELGTEWGAASLVDIANSGQMSGVNGARVRQSLVSRASSLRARNLAAIEEEAERRTEQMGLPMVLLFLSFLTFVGYPALAQTMGQL